MNEDIIDRLKVKEEEMEALINEAKKKASGIMEDAVRKARELKNIRIREIDEELRKISAIEEESIRNEAAKIEEEGRMATEDLRRRGEERKDRAVKEVIRFIIGEI